MRALSECYLVKAHLLAWWAEPKSQNIPQAIVLTNQAMVLDPTYGSCYSRMAFYLYRNGNPAEAVTVLENNLRYITEGLQGSAWITLSMAHWELNHYLSSMLYFAAAKQWHEKAKTPEGGHFFQRLQFMERQFGLDKTRETTDAHQQMKDERR